MTNEQLKNEVLSILERNPGATAREIAKELSVERRLVNQYLHGNLGHAVGASGLTAEFPWEEGACSAMLGDRTSLLQFSSDNPHPVAGNGLFFRLDLPITLAREQLAEMANELNVVEMNGVDTPPFFGAWCSQLDNGTLTFVGFWPNCMYRPGTVANIASWCRLRSRIARQVIGNRRKVPLF